MHQRMDIKNQEAANVFADPRQRGLLLKLVGREYALQELSIVSGMALSLLHYHMGRLQKLGLAEVARKIARKGRAIKRYRATAKAYFVPAYLGSVSAGGKLLIDLQAALEVSRWRHLGEGILYDVNEQLMPRMRRTHTRASGASTELWRSLRLTGAEVQAFSDDIRALLARYENRRGLRGRDHLFYFALAPRLTNGAFPPRGHS